MECERCHQRPATVHLTEIINNEKRTMRLCEQCARELQAQAMGFFPQINLHNFLAGLLHNEFGFPTTGPTVAPAGARCEACGLTEAQFARQGLLGCGECYRYFGPRLEPVFRRIHGNTCHTGKVPERTGGKVRVINRIERLKAQLREAISREEFERAAELRDTIRELEKELQEG
ncbi:UvrB/UvrC motif-containing protein [Desulfofundulus thermosubterraneus]|uniref:Protein-arginine kinase activator protein McsA n=1 Tax=Desulfofundulus thermosubterraneus DSM 16057 TaxID=1121432 RepID=A0A1M6JZ18_9FIRM|nr:UvrB/UvrC motif-containing protein [Desulfofundulus thermosubterraneus]SHJ51917.1 Protein-arginine kinase activator protein McsA [Desulfofundulus thermosubterraneus DSM 16057]